MIRVAIIGDGYAAADLVGFSPFMKYSWWQSPASTTWTKISEVYPSLTGLVDITLQETDLDMVKTQAEAAFLALPTGFQYRL